jgi:5-hydroxyisourate hydrolase
MADGLGGITTHVLDTSRGEPAAGVAVALERRDAEGRWIRLGDGMTDTDGRLRGLTRGEAAIAPGLYRLTFDTGSYFHARNRTTFFPEVQLVFDLSSEAKHCHVPLLVSPFGYTTYRGS